MLHDGARYTDEHAQYVIEQHLIGEVIPPTGQVTGCDPLAYCGGDVGPVVQGRGEDTDRPVPRCSSLHLHFS